MNVIRTLTISLAVACAGCKTFYSETAIYSGEYFYNFEFAYLTPNGEDERWCIDGNMAEAELPERWGKTYVVVEGRLGPIGSYGNLGACKRILTVTRLISVKNKHGRE